MFLFTTPQSQSRETQPANPVVSAIRQGAERTGAGFDYLLKVRVADMAAYSRFMMDTLLKHPSVQDCRTSFVMERVKSTTAVPLG